MRNVLCEMCCTKCARRGPQSERILRSFHMTAKVQVGVFQAENVICSYGIPV